MNLLRVTRDQFNWLISFGRKVGKLTPLEAAGGTIAFLFSQLFFVLSFFLPLKAILLLAMEGVPWYFDGLITNETKDMFVLAIASAAIASYGFHILGVRLLEQAVSNGAKRILSKSRKLHLFDDQADIARDGYRRLCRVVGSAVILALGFLLGFYVNALLFFLVYFS